MGKIRQKTKGQHYIPRFYLKRFSIKRNRGYYIWCYNLKTSKIFNSNISNVCKKNWFYDKHNVFEGTLSILERHHSKIYKIIYNNYKYTLIEPEKRLIAEFVYITHARTRKARERTLDVNEEVQYDEGFRKKFQDEFPGKNIEQELEGIRQTIQLANMFGIEIPEYDYDPKAEETIEKLMNYDYYILKNNTGKEFYTSDNPISQFTTSEKEDIKVAIPLAPDLFLIMSNSEEWMQMYPSQKILVNEWFVNKANEATIQAAKDFIFSRTNDFEFIRKYLKDQTK
ncbi:MAG: DUF4238 domain-containing protein [Candidatus Helarchaeota archaeon]